MEAVGWSVLNENLHHGMERALWASWISQSRLNVTIITYLYIARTSQQQTFAYGSRAALHIDNSNPFTTSSILVGSICGPSVQIFADQSDYRIL